MYISEVILNLFSFSDIDLHIYIYFTLFSCSIFSAMVSHQTTKGEWSRTLGTEAIMNLTKKLAILKLKNILSQLLCCATTSTLAAAPRFCLLCHTRCICSPAMEGSAGLNHGANFVVLSAPGVPTQFPVPIQHQNSLWMALAWWDLWGFSMNVLHMVRNHQDGYPYLNLYLICWKYQETSFFW